MKKAFVLIFFIILIMFPVNHASGEGIDFSYQNKFFFENNLYSINDLLRNDIFYPLNLNDDGRLIIDEEQRWTIKIDNNIYFGYIKESDSKYRADDDTIFFLTNQKENLEKEEYTIDFYSVSQSLEGIFIGGRVWQNDKMGLNVNLEGKYLVGKELIERNYQGSSVKQNGEYYLSGLRDGLYSNIGQQTEMHDVNFHSQGYSLGYNISWQIDDNSCFLFIADNVFSRINWYDVYTIVGKFDTNNLVLGEDGYYKYVSFFTGKFSYDDYVTTLTPEYDLSYKNNRSELGVFYRNKIYPYFNYLIIDKSFKLKTGFFSDMISLDFNYYNIEAGLKARNFNFDLDSSISAYISINISL